MILQSPAIRQQPKAGVRGVQRKTWQWDMGKNSTRLGAFGSCMVTADEPPAGGKGLKIEAAA